MQKFQNFIFCNLSGQNNLERYMTNAFYTFLKYEAF